MKNVYNKTFSCLKLFFCICFIELNFWMARDLILCPFKGSSFGIFNLDITLYITLPHYHIYYPIPHVPLMCNTPSLKNRPFLKRQEVGPLTSQVSPCYATLRFEWVFVQKKKSSSMNARHVSSVHQNPTCFYCKGTAIPNHIPFVLRLPSQLYGLYQ